TVQRWDRKQVGHAEGDTDERHEIQDHDRTFFRDTFLKELTTELADSDNTDNAIFFGLRLTIQQPYRELRNRPQDFTRALQPVTQGLANGQRQILVLIRAFPVFNASRGVN